MIQNNGIALATRTHNDNERNYPHIEKEALSLRFGVKKLPRYLYRGRFLLLIDHKQLTTIF